MRKNNSDDNSAKKSTPKKPKKTKQDTSKGKSFPSPPQKYADLNLSEFLDEVVPADTEIPEQIRLKYVLAGCRFERRASVDAKKLRARIGKVLAPIHDALAGLKEWKQWVLDSGIPRCPKTLLTWIHVADKVPPEAIEDPETSYMDVAIKYKCLSEPKVRFGKT